MIAVAYPQNPIPCSQESDSTESPPLIYFEMLKYELKNFKPLDYDCRTLH